MENSIGVAGVAGVAVVAGVFVVVSVTEIVIFFVGKIFLNLYRLIWYDRHVTDHYFLFTLSNCTIVCYTVIKILNLNSKTQLMSKHLN
jgi:hypothetical protein